MNFISKKYDTISIFLKFFVIFLVAHLTHNSSNMIAITGIVLTFGISYIFFLTNRDVFAFITLVFAGSHFFNFGAGYGGTFNHVALAGIGFTIIFFSKYKEIKGNSLFVGFLLFVFVLWNILGWVFRSPVPLYKLIFGVSAFFGFILIFLVLSKIALTKERLKLFIGITSLMSFWAMLISINTYFKLININSPFLISTNRRFEHAWSIQSGTFENHELYGEFGMLTFFLLIPFALLQKQTFKQLNLNKTIFWIGLISSFFNALFSFSKALYIELPIGIGIMVIFITVIKVKTVNRNLNFIKYLSAIMLIVLLIQPILPFEQIISERYSKGDNTVSNFYQDPITGKGTSREQSYTLGLARLNSDPWIIGFGWAPGREQRYAWFDNPDNMTWKADFHNLYYSAVPIFGWIGMVAFLFLILTITTQLFKLLIRFKNTDHYLVPFVVGLIFVFVFFLLDQWKINATRDAHYFMMVMIWLGIASSTINTLKVSR